jgi:hypothetical protein
MTNPTNKEQAARLEPLLLELIHNVPKSVIGALLDTSGSTSSHVNTMVSFLRSLSNLIDLNKNAVDRLALLAQFACSTHINCPWTNDKNKFDLAVQNLTRSAGGSTDTAKGLQLMERLFNETSTDANRVLLIFTDGGSNNASQTAQAAIRLRNNLNVKIICIGIGVGSWGGGINEIRSIASPNMDFIVDSFEDLRHIFNIIQVKPGHAPEMDTKNVSTESIFFKFETPDTKGVSLYHLEMLDSTTQMFKSVNNGVVRQEYLHEGLKPDTEYTFRLRAQNSQKVFTAYSPIMNIRTLRQYPMLHILRSKQVLQQEITRIRDKLKNAKPHPMVPRYNFLVLGPYGVGKSTTINGTTRVLGCPADAVTASQNDHVTTEVRYYDAIQFSDGTDYHFTWTDVFGWDKKGSNYQNNVLEVLIQGWAYDGLRMSNDGRIELKDNKLNKFATLKHEPHAILVIFDANSVTDQEQLDLLDKFRVNLSKLGFKIVLLVTKMDEVDDDLTRPEKISSLYDSNRVIKTLERIWQTTGTNIYDCIPTINYRENDPDCPVKTYLALRVLEVLFDNAEKRVNSTLMKQLGKDEFFRTRNATPAPAPNTQVVANEDMLPISSTMYMNGLSGVPKYTPPPTVQAAQFILVKKKDQDFSSKVPLVGDFDKVTAVIKKKLKFSDGDDIVILENNVSIDDMEELRNGETYEVIKC